MPRIDIPYGRGKLAADIPSHRLAGVLEAGDRERAGVTGTPA